MSASRVRTFEEVRDAKGRTGGDGAAAGRLLARFSSELTLDAMTPAARSRTAELILDLLGVAVRGASSPSSAPVREFVREQGPGGATVLGASGEVVNDSLRVVNDFLQDPRTPEETRRALRVAGAWAALANGTSAHAIEMDDVTTESSLHPGAAVIPAALAVAEEIAGSEGRVRSAETTSGARVRTVAGPSEATDAHPTPSKSRPPAPLGTRVIEAIAAGYEVTIRVGNALGAASAYQRGFHPTGVAGVFGAAVAAAKLLRLDAAGIERAIGIAGTMASGSLAYLDDGSWTKRLNPGWAAHGGVVAAGLARYGFTGPATALDGPHGVLVGYTDAPDPMRLTEGLGERELELMRVSIKPYGCCRYSHGLIDAVLALRAEQGISADDVVKMRLGVLSGGWPLIAEDIERKRDPRNTVDAQFSAPYAAAVALVRGRAGLREFESVDDPQLRALMARTECYRDPSLDAEYPRRWPAAVEIQLRDGRVLRKRIEHALGEPEHPVGREALIERFTEMVGGRPDARAIAERILRLEEAPDLSLLEALE